MGRRGPARSARAWMIPVALIAAGSLWLGPRHEAHSASSGLALHASPVPWSENGLRVLAEADWESFLDSYQRGGAEVIREFLDSGRRAAEAADLRSRSRELVAVLRRVIAAPRFQSRDYDAPAEEHIPYLLQCLALGKTGALHSRFSFVEGDTPAAWGLALDVVRLARTLEGANGTPGSHSIAQSIRSLGTSEIRALAADPGADPSALEHASRALAELGPDLDGYARTCRLELGDTLDVIERVERGEPLPAYADCWRRLPAPFAPLKRICFREDLTRDLAEASCRWHAESAGRVPFSRLPPWPVPAPGAWRLLFNRSGEGFLETEPGPDVRSIYLGLFDVAATRAVLALRAWKRDRGDLPASLSDLTPDYLPSVPRDPYDGESLRFLPDRGRLYSVGEDLIDASGEGERCDDALEPCVVIGP